MLCNNSLVRIHFGDILHFHISSWPSKFYLSRLEWVLHVCSKSEKPQSTLSCWKTCLNIIIIHDIQKMHLGCFPSIYEKIPNQCKIKIYSIKILDLPSTNLSYKLFSFCASKITITFKLFSFKINIVLPYSIDRLTRFSNCYKTIMILQHHWEKLWNLK